MMPVPVRGGNQSYFLRRQSLENKKEFAAKPIPAINAG